MSDADLEQELIRWRTSPRARPPSNAVRLETDEALAYRNAGNLPDDKGRTLRLVLVVEKTSELASLDDKRLMYEPDFHDAPKWRIAGARAVNVVPLRGTITESTAADAWWEEPELAALEEEWQQHGTVAGVAIPAGYRSCVYKTVLSLQAAGKEVTAASIADSIERWVAEQDALRIRAALEEANRTG